MRESQRGPIMKGLAVHILGQDSLKHGVGFGTISTFRPRYDRKGPDLSPVNRRPVHFRGVPSTEGGLGKRGGPAREDIERANVSVDLENASEVPDIDC